MMNMKKQYTTPEWNMIELLACDVLTSSGEGEGDFLDFENGVDV